MLLTKIKCFCERTAMPRTKFGRLAVSDPRLVDDLRRGRRAGPGIEAKCERFMAEYHA
jgi:hypothetical protein